MSSSTQLVEANGYHGVTDDGNHAAWLRLAMLLLLLLLLLLIAMLNYTRSSSQHSARVTLERQGTIRENRFLATGWSGLTGNTARFFNKWERS